MASRSVELKVETVDAGPSLGVRTRRVKLSLENAVGISDCLFLVRQVRASDDLPTFVTVACAADLDNYNEDAPPEDEPSEPFRVNSVTLTTDLPTGVTGAIRDVRRRLLQLLISLEELDQCDSVTTYTISVADNP